MSNAAKMMEVALDRIVSLSQDECKIIARFTKEQEKNQNLTELLEEYKKDLELTHKRLGDSLQERKLLAEGQEELLKAVKEHKETKQHLAEQKNNYELLDAARQDQINELLKQRNEKNGVLRQIRAVLDAAPGSTYGPVTNKVHEILVSAGFDRQPKTSSPSSLEGGLSG